METDEYSHQVQHLESNLFGLLESFDSSIFVPISFIEFIIFIHDMSKSTPSTQCTVHSLRHNVRDDCILIFVSLNTNSQCFFFILFCK